MLQDRAPWREVVEDILSAIPQPDIRRRLPSFSTTELQRLATRLGAVDTSLSYGQAEPHIFHLELDDWLAVELVPGGEYIVALGAHAELALLDVHTGNYVQTWFEETEPGIAITHVELTPCLSPRTEGFRLLVVADHNVYVESVSFPLTPTRVF